MYKPEYNPDFFYHWTTLRIRFRDLDPLQHVNNAIYSSYFEEARIRYIDEHMPELAEGMKSGNSFVVVDLHLQFVAPATYPNELLIGSGLSKSGNSSLTAYQAIYNKKDHKLLCVGETTGVWFNLDKQRPTRLPNISNLADMMINMSENK